MQQYLTDGDLDGFLRELDRSWDQVAQRRTWGLGAVAA
jgi:raffinose/stachyose/melibiose transport system substrate-binding protein